MKYLEKFNENTENNQFFILNWMDGSREYFKTEKEAVLKFLKMKNESIEENSEFDMSVMKLIMEYNNID